MTTAVLTGASSAIGHLVMDDLAIDHEIVALHNTRPIERSTSARVQVGSGGLEHIADHAELVRRGNLGGDGSIRLTYANFCVEAPLECVRVIIEGPWPPGQAVMLAPFLWVGG